MKSVWDGLLSQTKPLTPDMPKNARFPALTPICGKVLAQGPCLGPALCLVPGKINFPPPCAILV